jgi:SAM-dependent methyltransferase
MAHDASRSDDSFTVANLEAPSSDLGTERSAGSRLGHDEEMVTDSWTSADPYEPFMGRWSRLLADDVMAWLNPSPGLRWLDVGCGTGALTAAVLDAASPESVVGIDPSAAYVTSAARRLPDARISFQVGEAAALPLPDSSVDEVVSGLVLNFVPDPVAALHEVRRVLAVGGRAAAYVWDYSAGMRMLRHFWDAAAALDSAAAQLDEGVRFPLCRPSALEICFRAAGLHDLQTSAVEIMTRFVDFDDYWQPFLGSQGPAPVYCTSLPAGARDRLREALRDSLPADGDGAIRLTARAWAISGRSH